MTECLSSVLFFNVLCASASVTVSDPLHLSWPPIGLCIKALASHIHFPNRVLLHVIGLDIFILFSCSNTLYSLIPACFFTVVSIRVAVCRPVLLIFHYNEYAHAVRGCISVAYRAQVSLGATTSNAALSGKNCLRRKKITTNSQNFLTTFFSHSSKQ